MLYRLDTPDLADALAGRTNQDEQAAALAREVADAKERMAYFIGMHARGEITRAEWLTARADLVALIDERERRLARTNGDHALRGLVGTGAALRRQWDTLNLTRQAAIIRAVLDHAIIGPGVNGARSLDRTRVEPIWRL